MYLYIGENLTGNHSLSPCIKDKERPTIRLVLWIINNMIDKLLSYTLLDFCSRNFSEIGILKIFTARRITHDSRIQWVRHLETKNIFYSLVWQKLVPTYKRDISKSPKNHLKKYFQLIGETYLYASIYCTC